MDGSLDGLRAKLESAGLTHHADALLALARPSVRLLSSPVASEDEIAIGASKLGGRPDVPVGFVWPRHHGMPLAFVAQVDLATVTAFDTEHLLPGVGLLSFFIHPNQYGGAEDPNDRTDWRVIHIEATSDLLRHEFPDDLSPDGEWDGPTRYGAAPLEPWFAYSLPPNESVAIERVGLRQSGFGDEVETWRYAEVRPDQSPAHRLLGYPRQMQGDIQRGCEREILEIDWSSDDAPTSEEEPDLSGAEQWRLLLQIDSDRHAKMSWCDDDTLYYMIRDDDLRSRRWDQTWVVIECS